MEVENSDVFCLIDPLEKNQQHKFLSEFRTLYLLKNPPDHASIFLLKLFIRERKILWENSSLFGDYQMIVYYFLCWTTKISIFSVDMSLLTFLEMY